MNAKWSISNLPALAAICLLMLWCGPLSAQERDTVIIVKHDTVYLQHKPDTVVTGRVRHSRYDRRVHRYRKRWEALIPTHTKIQFAGNMGLLSLGTGWDYGKRNQWETDVFLGVLPKYQSDCTKLTFTLKQNYIPWSLQIKESRFSAEPLTCGMYFNTVFGDEFWVKNRIVIRKATTVSRPKYHPCFSRTAHPYDIDPRRRFTAKAITLFYEISTCDLYIVSAFTNKYLKPKDYLSLSFGVKLQLL